MPRQANSSAGAPGASVIENTVVILRCFGPDRHLLGVTEIAQQVGQHKSTVSRTLTPLEREGIVEQIPSTHQVKHTSSLGSRYGTALSATVQVFLCGEDPERVRQLLSEETITGVEEGAVPEHLERLAGLAELGYAVNFAEAASEGFGVAAPVRDHRGMIVAAVLIAASRVTLRLGGPTDNGTER